MCRQNDARLLYPVRSLFPKACKAVQPPAGRSPSASQWPCIPTSQKAQSSPPGCVCEGSLWLSAKLQAELEKEVQRERALAEAEGKTRERRANEDIYRRWGTARGVQCGCAMGGGREGC